jgi:16S rRNA (cytosine967-C5)-methyltransferase
VREGGTLIYSTCTIAKEENQNNVFWFVENYPYELESLDPYLPEQLHSETTKKGWIQLLPGVHKTDGFFIARLKRTKK